MKSSNERQRSSLSTLSPEVQQPVLLAGSAESREGTHSPSSLFRAKDNEALTRIFQQIDALEKTPIQITRFVKYEEIGKPALPLGTRLDPRFDEMVFDIRDGDTLLAYTDGVTEIQNPAGDMYGDGRLKSVLVDSAARQVSAQAIRDPILSDISWFKDRAQQVDDLSFVVEVGAGVW